MNAPDLREPDESQEEYSELWREKEWRQYALCQRIQKYDRMLAQEVLAEFGLK